VPANKSVQKNAHRITLSGRGAAGLLGKKLAPNRQKIKSKPISLIFVCGGVII
jgi:hypothetical protein